MLPSQQNIIDQVKLPLIQEREKSNSQSRINKAVEQHKNKINNMTNPNHNSGQDSLSMQKKKSLDTDFSIPGPSFFNKHNRQISQMYQDISLNQTQKHKFRKINHSISSFITDAGGGAAENSQQSTAFNYFMNPNQSMRNTSYTLRDLFLNSTQTSQFMNQTKASTQKPNFTTLHTQQEESKQSPTNTSFQLVYQKFNDKMQADRQKTLNKIQNQPFNNVSNIHQRRKSYDINDNPFKNKPVIPFTNSPLLNVNQIEKVCFLRSKQAKQDFYLQLMGKDPKRSEPQYLSDIDLLKQKVNQQKDINIEDQFIQKVKSISQIGQKNILTPHNSQNHSLKKSSERKDIFLLSQWMEQMLELLFGKEKKYWNYEDFFDQVETLYTGCMQEIARQVSIECSERGQLVSKVWEIYTTIVRQFLQRSQQEQSKMETEFLQSQKSIQLIYLNDLDNMKSENKKLNELLELRNNQISKAKAENRYLSKKWKKMEKAYQVVQEDFSAQMALYEEALKEITYLKMQQEEFILQDQIRHAALEEDQQQHYVGNSKFMQEIEKIKMELTNQYQFLYLEEKKKLEEAYLINKQTQEKQLILAQEIDREDEELGKNQLLRIQEYTFDDILLANIGVDTSDLFKQTSFGTDTCDLVEKEDKGINVNIQKQTKFQSTQTGLTTENKATQVNIRSILNDVKILSIEEQHYLNKLQSTKFSDLIKEYKIFQIGENNLKDKEDYGKDMIQKEFNRIKKETKTLMNVAYTKEDMTQKDFIVLSEFICKVFSSSESFIFKLIVQLKNVFYDKNTTKIDCIDAQIDNCDLLIKLDEKKQQYNYLQQIYVTKVEQLQKAQLQNKSQTQLTKVRSKNKQFLSNNQPQIKKYFNKGVSPTISSPDYLKQKRIRGAGKKIDDNSQNFMFANKSAQKNILSGKESKDGKDNKEKDKQVFRKDRSFTEKNQKVSGKDDSKIGLQSKGSSADESTSQKQIKSQKSISQIVRREQSLENSKEANNQISNNQSPALQSQLQSLKEIFSPLEIGQSISQPDQILDNLSLEGLQENLKESLSSQSSEDNEQVKQQKQQEAERRLSEYVLQQNGRTSLLILDSQNDPFFKNINPQQRINTMKQIFDDLSLDTSQQSSMISYKSDELIEKDAKEDDEIENDQSILEKQNILQTQNSQILSQPKIIKEEKNIEIGNKSATKIDKDNTNVQQETSIKSPILQNQTSILQEQEQEKEEDTIHDEDEKNNQQNKTDKLKKQVTIDTKITQSIFGKQQKYISVNTKTKTVSSKLIDVLNESESESEKEDLELTDLQGEKIKEEILQADLKPTKPINSLISRFRLFVSDSKNAQIATDLLDKQLKGMPQKFKKAKDALQLNQVLKLTSQCLVEIFKSAQSGNTSQKYQNPYHIYLYDTFVNTFGQNTMTVSKYNKYIKSCFYYAQENARLKLMSKFLTGEYDKMSYQFYIDSIIHLDETGQKGLGIVSLSDDQCWINPKTIADYVETIFGKVLQKDKLAKAQRYLFTQREKVNINNISKIVLDLDQCLLHIIDLYEEIKLGFTKRYSDLFSSVDVQNNGLLEFDQFQLILKNVEDDIYKFDNFSPLELFTRECDNITVIGNKKLMSLLRFTQMSIDHNLFTLTSQNHFLDCNVEEEILKIKSVWPDIKRKFKMRLIKGQYYNSLFKSIIDKVDDFFSKQKINSKYQTSIIFSIRILEQESKNAMIGIQLNDIVCQDFLAMQSHFISLKNKKIVNRTFKIHYEKRKEN